MIVKRFGCTTIHNTALYKCFLRVMFSTATIQTHPGQSITMWCPHNIHVTGNLYWFKQSDGAVPVTIVHMLYTESLQKVEPNYFNSFTNDCIVMDQFSKSTTLTIKQVKISDSGFYFCGATGYHMKFGTGTRLEVKGNLFEPLSLYSNFYILEHRRQKHKKGKLFSHVEYAAVYFSNKRPKTGGRHTEDPTAVYSIL
uniref:Novel immune-type receptor 10a n=1 Tax=Sinocyclocheilus anshuiensis TaxID=1608454 RepID=A0A671SLA7_9TELE